MVDVNWSEVDCSRQILNFLMDAKNLPKWTDRIYQIQNLEGSVVNSWLFLGYGVYVLAFGRR